VNAEELWELEERFWKGDERFYRDNLSDDSLMVFSGMVLTKDQTVQTIAGGARWADVAFDNRRVVLLTDDAVALNYQASARREGATPYTALATSVYVRRNERWHLALHQQTT
jgi:hypothetical protein